MKKLTRDNLPWLTAYLLTMIVVLGLGSRTWPPTTVGVGGGSPATTTAAGVVELATNREDAANVVVQGNDSRLDPFIGSGATHATGLVPDPGASNGDTAFLNENGSFVDLMDIFDDGIEISDNLADAFNIGESTNDYMIFTSLNSSEAITAYKPFYTTNGVTSGTPVRVGGILCSNVTASTALLGTTETPQVYDTTCDIPANTLKAGTFIRIRGSVIHTVTNLAEAHGYVLRFDNTDICTTATSFDPTNNDRVNWQWTGVMRAPGASGTLIGSGQWTLMASGGSGGTAIVGKECVTGSGGTSSVAVDTTQTLTVGLAMDYNGTTLDSSSTRLDFMTVEVY